MSSTISIHILTPLGSIYKNEAMAIVVPTVSGKITVRREHIPLISAIQSGECEIITAENERVPFAVWNGVLEVRTREGKTQALLLVDRSEHAYDIDVEKAEAALKRAEEIKDSTKIEDVDFARFEALIDKELNRIKVGRKYK